MLKQITSKLVNSLVNPEPVMITTDEVVLEALCAYRDALIMHDSYPTQKTQAKLALLQFEIADVASRIQNQ